MKFEGTDKNLLSLGQLDDIGCKTRIENMIMKIVKGGVLVVMKAEEFAANLIGQSGGIGVLWRKSEQVTVTNYSSNHVDLRVSDDMNGDWRYTRYYGYPERTRRRDSWNLIRSLAAQSNLSWLCIGDYNDKLSTEDKRGRIDQPQWLLRGFREAIDDCNLTYIPLLGHQFTWERSRGTENFVEERIDRQWKQKSRKRCSISISSDLKTAGLENPNFTQDEDYWRQRAKQYWLKEGDRNTRFFHTSASARKQTNKISGLKDADGHWQDEQNNICGVVQNYFQNLFAEVENMSNEVKVEVQPCVTERQNEELLRSFTLEEFKEAVFYMKPDKSPGPDGFNPAFYQRFWTLIGIDVFSSCVGWLQAMIFPPTLNDANVVLIPKCKNPQAMKDFRPISLCDVLYKIISKVLANRLKKVLPHVISPFQSAFVAGRSITDNIQISFEITHYMKRQTRGKIKNTALKFDISKAYDRIEWNYFIRIMEKMGFAPKWIQYMKLCVTTNAGRLGQVHGIKVCRGALSISHLFFADDKEIQRMINSFWWGRKQNSAKGLNWLRWEKLCVPKEYGGMGFRDFYGFNLSMLGKQGWKLISDPNATICRIYKAKYYPRRDFLNANLGHNPSFAWRSILASQVVLKRGYRWRIGDGSHINIWKDPWLRDPSNLFVEKPMIPELHHWTVQELMIPGARE
ncbi:uncharacterized protein [Primulina huaijiensis]|uniref:uncharacterized protein n=1 Tax=Primulina huaijiensis TaxID=1492673 RepID=UPI003CC7816E